MRGHWHWVALGTAVALLLTAVIYALTFSEDSDGESRLDSFGVAKLHQSAPGQHWESHWDQPRDLSSLDEDPADPWMTFPDSQASYEAGGGEFRISGHTPRMYVHDPAKRGQWGNVEVTMYFKRVSDHATPYAGMTSVARANHGTTGPIEDNPCDTRGIGGRMRYDGTTDFEREISHPESDAQHAVTLWPGGMPKDVWLGYKYLVYDLPDGRVKLQLWLDETDGKNGGSWRLVNELVDDGHVFGKGMDPCVPGIDPGAVLDSSGSRAGSESGKPNISVYFRSDNVGEHGLVYKKGSVREIRP